jgi:hypothetical protein
MASPAEPAPSATADFLATLAAPVLAARALAAKAGAGAPPPAPEIARAPQPPVSGAAFFAALRELDTPKARPAPGAPPAPPPPATPPALGLFDSLKRDVPTDQAPQKPLRDLLRRL